MSYLAHRRKYFQIPGCVAYYTLNEASGNAIDSVAGNDGTPSGVTYGATGKIGDAYTFDGVNDYVNIDSALTPLASTTVGTWSCWVKPVDATPAGNRRSLSFGDTDADTYIAITHTTAGLCRFTVTLAGVQQFNINTDAAAFSDGVWALVCVVQDGVSPIIYIDGVAVAQTFIVTTDTTAWFSDLSGLDNGRLGAFKTNLLEDLNFFDGSIDEVALFDTALTAAQVLELYNSGTGKTYPF
jgi:hypothetical protein